MAEDQGRAVPANRRRLARTIAAPLIIAVIAAAGFVNFCRYDLPALWKEVTRG